MLPHLDGNATGTDLCHASVIKCCVLWKRKKDVPPFSTVQDSSTTFVNNLHRENNCTGKSNNMVKKKKIMKFYALKNLILEIKLKSN